MAHAMPILQRAGSPARWPPLLATRFALPPVGSDIVARRRLFDRLKRGVQGKLTLITAPAGFGKTTLLADGLRQLPMMGGDELQPAAVAWVSLHVSDNDPTQFWTYVIAALDNLAPGLGEEALALLRQAQAPIEVVLTALLNAAAKQRATIILVLDDYHNINNRSIHDSLAFLLDYLPATMHLLIAGRSEPPLPLARLRGHRQMTEIRAADLRFTRDEVAAFFTTVIGKDLSAEEAAALESRTEGWIAGLQLAALAMQGREDVADFLNTFRGSHRYVLDYLAEEVLQRQPAHVQRFLLQTSILDRMTDSLCDAVLGAADAHDPATGADPANVRFLVHGTRVTLRDLERASLFLIPLDEERHWYRYHQLFADFLYSRLTQIQPDLLPLLHRRAAAWYAQHGFHAEAIGHAVAAGDTAMAATLIEEHARAMLVRGEIASLREWLTALPDDVIAARPQLCCIHAWLLLNAGQLDAAEWWFQAAERGAATLADPVEVQRVAGQVAALRTLSAALQKKGFARTPELIHQALAHAPESDLYFELEGEIAHPKPKIQNLPEPLSERELEVLRLVADGRSNQEISDALVIAVSTVKMHIKNIYGKLGVHNRVQAVAYAREAGLL